MSMPASQLIQRFEQHFPLWLGEEGDPNGLHIGTLDKPIQRVMVTLDVRPNVVDEAIERGVDLIIAKHPPIFRPVSRLTEEDPQIAMYLKLIRHNIAVYAAHTNMDIVPDGLNDWFCDALGIHDTTYLTQTNQFPDEILTVMVPHRFTKEVKDALIDAGAGEADGYHGASFIYNGVGTAIINKDNFHPELGQPGDIAETDEDAIVVKVPALVRPKVEEVLKQYQHHEVPTHYFTKMTNEQTTFGIGRIGQLEEAITVEDMAQRLKSVFDLDHVRVISKDPTAKVQRIAICGGSGQKFYTDAKAKGADLYITGDVYYHTGHDMLESGMSVIDCGHYIEHYCKQKIVDKLNQWKQELNWDVECFASEADTNPFKAY